MMLPISAKTEAVLKSTLPHVNSTVIHPALPKPALLHLQRHSSSELIILCVAAIKRRKGQLHLVRAMEHVCKQFPKAKCFLVGSHAYAPDYLAEINNAIDKLQLHSTVYLLGHVTEQKLLSLYASASVFVFPIVEDTWRFEGYGLALLEAAAANIPIITSANTVAEDIIQHNVTGILVDFSSITSSETLASEISGLLADANLANRLSMSAKAKLTHRTWLNVASEINALYHQCLQ